MSTKWEDLPKSFGYVQQLQVEHGPAGPLMLCGLKPENTAEMEHFILPLADINPIVDAQIHLLRDAIVYKMKVRITHQPSESGASRIVAVRLQVQ